MKTTTIHTSEELAGWLMKAWGFHDLEMRRLYRKRHPPLTDVLADLKLKRQVVTKAIDAVEALLNA